MLPSPKGKVSLEGVLTQVTVAYHLMKVADSERGLPEPDVGQILLQRTVLFNVLVQGTIAGILHDNHTVIVLQMNAGET